MKTKTIVLLLFLVLSVITAFCQSFRADFVEQQWATEPGLKVPESVCFDAVRNIIYVSSINGNPSEKDGNGFISKVTLDGKISDLEWITGLDAPKGMGIINNDLYVSDINRVVKIDIEKGEISGIFESGNAQFLNDITTDPAGIVYISDMAANTIYSLKDDKLEPWLVSNKLNSPNGLFFENGILLAGLQNEVVRIDIKTKELTTYIANTGGIDGLVSDGRGDYLISDWQGKTNIIHPEKEKILILDTTHENINAADIDYIPGKALLLVPTFSDNRVVAYKLNFQ